MATIRAASSIRSPSPTAISSRIISKGIAAGASNNTYRGLVSAHRRATGARNFTNCDSLLIGDKCGAHTVPYIEAKNSSATLEHEATTSKISEDMLFYCRQRGMSAEEATALVVNGFVKDVLQQLPMESVVAMNLLADRSNVGAWLAWAAFIVIAVLLMVRISRQRTNGEWRWRWGQRPR